MFKALLGIQPLSAAIYDKKSLQEGANIGLFYGLKFEGRVLDLEVFGTGRTWDRGVTVGGVRGCVKEFSWASRRRLLKQLGKLSWAMLGQVWFVTLTYPDSPGGCPAEMWPGVSDEFGRPVFRTGADFKRDLATLRKQIERKYGDVFAVWKMEFQWKTRNGVPHFHLVLRLPGAGLADGPDLEVFRREIASWWFGIVGSGNLNHLIVGTGVEVARTDCARYFSYSLKEKGRQDRVPDWLDRPGRIWGVWRATRDPPGFSALS